MWPGSMTCWLMDALWPPLLLLLLVVPHLPVPGQGLLHFQLPKQGHQPARQQGSHSSRSLGRWVEKLWVGVTGVAAGCSAAPTLAAPTPPLPPTSSLPLQHQPQPMPAPQQQTRL
ncbi:hypothetical protein V8C86DRAFT_2562393 [Haematococcus lacustris]